MHRKILKDVCSIVFDTPKIWLLHSYILVPELTARVMKLVDVLDSKSSVLADVSVRLRPRAPTVPL